MRITIALAVACLTASSFVSASAPETSVRKAINIEAQALEPALQAFSREHGLQVVFRSETVGDMKTAGAKGDLTADEALRQLLSGTGLTFEYLDERTVTIEAIAPGPAASAGHHKSSVAFAQAANTAQGAGATSSSIDKEDTPGAKIEEIVVTAQKREERLQDVPISVRALSGEELQRLGADGIEEYAAFAPGLNLIQKGPGHTQIDMRGVTIGGVRNDRPEFGPTVGIYLDEAPMAVQYVNANIGLIDLERIEVMRGPQATLYGAGSLSGTIRMITRKPNLTEAAGRLGTGISYTQDGAESLDFNGMANIPLVPDKLALRAVGFYRDQAGYIDNVVLGTENTNGYRDVGGRLALRFEPKEFFRLNASIAYQDSNIDSSFYYFLPAGDLNSQLAAPTPSNSELTIGSLVGEIDFAAGTVTSATSYFSYFNEFGGEISRIIRFITGTPFTAPPGATGFIGVDTPHYDLSEFTQELRFVSKDEGRVSWIGGALFQQKNYDFGEDFPVPGVDAVTGIPSTDFLVEQDVLYKSAIDLKTKAFSLFAETSVKLSDRLTAKAGLRWFDVSTDSTTFFGGIFAFPNVGTQPASYSENGINPTFNVSYAIDDHRLLYLQAARGFRLGGTNQPIPEALCAPYIAAAGFTSPPEAFDSDTLWNYEAGLKSSWLNDRLRVNSSAYVIDWQDPPYPVGFGCGFSTVINAGEFNISGAELDVEAALAKGLVSRLGLAYTNSELGEDIPLANAGKGGKAPYAPQYTASFSLDYDFPLGRGGLMAFVHGDVRWVDERVTGLPLVGGGSNFFSLPAYSEGNLRTGIYSGVWRVEAFVENLWNERPELTKDDYVLGEFPGLRVMTSRPRTYGMQLIREF